LSVYALFCLASFNQAQPRTFETYSNRDGTTEAPTKSSTANELLYLDLKCPLLERTLVLQSRCVPTSVFFQTIFQQIDQNYLGNMLCQNSVVRIRTHGLSFHLAVASEIFSVASMVA
jgi:hypothetical protein